jgi:2'-5' RNA ligase
MTIAGVGHFSGGGQVKALWAGVARNPELIALQERVDNALKRAGIPKDRARFTPHVTLARLRDAPVSRISGFLQAHSLLRIGPITVDRFVLFSSHLHADGPIYTVEAEYELAHAFA